MSITAQSRHAAKPSLKRFLPDLLSVAAIWIGVTLLTQRWAGLDTPDSSFYTSLGLFGSEVSDRAYDNSYFWTRLGTIAPTHLLTSVAGTWGGFAIWHALLLLIFIAGAYITIKKFSNTSIAAVLTACIALSSVPLSYLANPYLTGAVLAGTSALIATAMFDSRKAAIAAGLILGWLVMVNPPGVLLAGVIWLVIKIQRQFQQGKAKEAASSNSIKQLGTTIGLAAIATAATFLVFLGIGKVIFPELNWVGAYLDAQGINLSNFASKDPVWLKDISLLVPASILIFVAAVWFKNKMSNAAQLGFAISASSVAFMLVFSPIMGGIALEAPMYQAMLWPPALIALALAIVATTKQGLWNLTSIITAAVVIVIIATAGHSTAVIGLHKGWLVAAALTVIAIIISIATKPKFATIAGLVAICVIVAGGQLLQNSRGPLGLYYLSPYNWAYNDNPISEKLHTAVNTQEWLLANTKNADTILTWVQGDWVGGDRELYVVAGMQLWGENRIGLFRELNDDDLARLNDIKPSVIAMYGQTKEGINTFMQSLPPTLQTSTPTCYDFTWPTATIPVGHACLTRLTWTNA
jgi:hypothetical protein